jgi:hypothetical protein
MAAQPGKSLAGELQQSRAQAEQVTCMQPSQPATAENSSGNKQVPGWNEQQRPAISQKATAAKQAVSLADRAERANMLMQEVKALDSKLNITGIVLGKPRIKIAAAQVLKHAAGEQLCSSTCGSFAAMGTHHPGIIQLSNATGRAAGEIVENLDSVRSHGYNQQHISTAALKREVQQCMEIIDLFPDLRQECFWECWVLENYAHLKARFPVLKT